MKMLILHFLQVYVAVYVSFIHIGYYHQMDKRAVKMFPMKRRIQLIRQSVNNQCSEQKKYLAL